MEQKSLASPDAELLAMFGAIPATSGVSVTAATALRVPAVAQAVRLISEAAGVLPFKIYTRAGKAQRHDHPAFRLIHQEANEWTSAAELRIALTADALLHGHGFAQVARLGDGTPAELHRLEPTRVTPKSYPDGEPFFELRTDAGPQRLAFADVLHVHAFGGVSPITLAREAIGLAISYEQHAAQLYANGARPGGVITSPKTLDAEAKRKLAASWQATHGTGRQGGTALLDEGMGYQQLALSLADAQFLEGRVEQVREIARAFGIPPVLLFELSRATWSNAEEMGAQFLTTTLRPWLEAWSWAYARALLTPEERRECYVEAVVDDLLSTSHADRAEAYSKYRAMGALTANEVRAGLNLPPHADGEALANPYTSTGAAPAPATSEPPAEEAA